jgi:hypothetical protein
MAALQFGRRVAFEVCAWHPAKGSNLLFHLPNAAQPTATPTHKPMLLLLLLLLPPPSPAHEQKQRLPFYAQCKKRKHHRLGTAKLG